MKSKFYFISPKKIAYALRFSSLCYQEFTISTWFLYFVWGHSCKLSMIFFYPSIPSITQSTFAKKTGVTGNWMEAAIRWKFKQKPSGIKLLLLCHGRQVFRRSGAVVVNCSLTFITPDRAARSHQQLWMQKKHEEMRAMCYYRRLFSPNEIQWINRSGLGNPFLARRIEIDVIQC